MKEPKILIDIYWTKDDDGSYLFDIDEMVSDFELKINKLSKDKYTVFARAKEV